MDEVKMNEIEVEEKKPSTGKKVGYFFLSWTPLLAYFAIMLGVTVVGTFIIGFIVGMQAAMNNVALTETYLMESVMEYAMPLSLAYGILGLICMTLWYYFGCKRKQLKPAKGVMQPVNIACIALLAFAMQYVVNYLMVAIGALLPDAMENYEQLMETAGIGEVTVIGILYVGIVGPIVEEFTFRGVTLYYTQKATKRFWLANLIQALGFGILHMNLIQGLYAFALGILIGWLYNRFRSLYVVCLFHMIFNLLSFGAMELIDGLLPQNLIFQIVWAVVMFAVAVFCIWMLHNRGKNLAEGEVA